MDTETIEVEVKPTIWGRRHADRKIKITVPNPKPKYPGRAPIAKELLDKHSRGEGINKKGVKTGIYKKKFEKKERVLKFAHEQAARTEILLPEQSG